MRAALQYTVADESGVISVVLRGRMTLGPSLREFAKTIGEMVAQGGKRAVLLDLDALAEVDSAGLGELVTLHTRCQEYDCRLCLIRVSPHVLRILDITRLSGLLPHFNDARSAEAWLAKAKKAAR